MPAAENRDASQPRWVTTVIPTFERAPLLRRAVSSVLNQNYPYTRVNVFDNRSIDETESVMAAFAANFPDRVTYRKNETNIGSLLNFDRAIKSADTDFFSIMSDDDILLPNFVESAIAQMDAHPEADIVSGRTWGVDQDGKVLNSGPLGFPNGFLAAPEGAELFLQYRHPDWHGMLFRRNVLSTCGWLNPNVEGFDVDFVVRAAAIHGIFFYEDDVALFVRHRNAATFDLKLQYIYPSYLKMLESIELDGRIPDSFKSFARAAMPKVLQDMLRPYILREMVKDSPRELDLAIEGLLAANKSFANRALAFGAHAATKSSLIRKAAQTALGIRRQRTQAKVAELGRSYDFTPYLHI
jgi:glycosyltransferase involved in cell wall biosynthesis